MRYMSRRNLPTFNRFHPDPGHKTAPNRSVEFCLPSLYHGGVNSGVNTPLPPIPSRVSSHISKKLEAKYYRKLKYPSATTIGDFIAPKAEWSRENFNRDQVLDRIGCVTFTTDLGKFRTIIFGALILSFISPLFILFECLIFSHRG